MRFWRQGERTPTWWAAATLAPALFVLDLCGHVQRDGDRLEDVVLPGDDGPRARRRALDLGVAAADAHGTAALLVACVDARGRPDGRLSGLAQRRNDRTWPLHDGADRVRADGPVVPERPADARPGRLLLHLHRRLCGTGDPERLQPRRRRRPRLPLLPAAARTQLAVPRAAAVLSRLVEPGLGDRDHRRPPDRPGAALAQALPAPAGRTPDVPAARARGDCDHLLRVGDPFPDRDRRPGGAGLGVELRLDQHRRPARGRYRRVRRSGGDATGTGAGGQSRRRARPGGPRPGPAGAGACNR